MLMLPYLLPTRWQDHIANQPTNSYNNNFSLTNFIPIDSFFLKRPASMHEQHNSCVSPRMAVWCKPTTCKTRPAGRVRPATLFCPAREMFLNYNGNRPSACHRPQLHYTIEGLSCLRLHRLKTNVITTFIFVDNALLNARWIVWILISNDIFVDRSFH